jgi:UDP-N-acetylglucosamine/UDP-N-acetylgalactosamine diphosphorylase
MSSEMPSHDDLLARLAPFGQQHVLRWWPDLTTEQQAHLAAQILAIDLELVQRLHRQMKAGGDNTGSSQSIQPAPVRRLAESFEDWEQEQQAAEVGEQALRNGEVALLMVAGGLGTRLGYPGPKGTFPIGPVSGASLYQIHAEKALALSRRYETPIPLHILTSPDNHEPTRAFLAEHRFFGLPSEQVTLFMQGSMPAVDAESGRLLLESKHEIATSPNGHGGVIQTLADGGRLDAMTDRGIRHIFYFQVDNPLLKMADPVFLGQHIQAGADVSVKVVARAHAGERVGVLVEQGGNIRVIEYMDLTPEQAERRGPDGELALWAANTAIHLFDVGFFKRLDGGLPFHRALKTVPYLDEQGNLVRPARPNAMKFEMFVFDAFALARKVLLVETSRFEEFEPLKNAEGENSPVTVRRAMIELHARWLEQAGVHVPRQPDGVPVHPVEIGPLYALDSEEVRDRVADMEAITGPTYLR